jgi:aldehyde dehydrogenase (NAD+)
MTRPAIPQVHLHIGSQRLTTGSGGVYDHVNPATGEVDAQVPHGGAAEVDAAVEAADAGFQDWRRWNPAARRDVLMKFANLMEEKAEIIGHYATMDSGLPSTVTPFHGPFAKTWMAYYAGLADKIEGEVTSSYMNDSDFAYTHKEPYGVVGLFHTWNGPFSNLVMKAAPALAAGNTFVCKPSEFAPFSLELFMDLAREAGIPDGVCNIVHGGPAVGQALVQHPKVKKVSFTGGPVGARKILATCAELIKPAVLELGGKSANLVFADGDLDAAAQYAALFSVGLISGQGCAFPTRLLVEESVYEEVIEKVLAVAGSFKVGDPWENDTVVGPLISEASLERTLGIIERTKANGDGKLILGGQRVGGQFAKGFYVEPTIFRDVDNKSTLAQEEVFGPVLAIMKFSTEEEAIEMANDSQYGLAAYIQSKDLERVHRVATQLNAGSVYVNGGKAVVPTMPFGGLGISGFGREGGRQGLEEFLQSKSVGIGSVSGKAGASFP